jgi:hypothetical protein
MEDREDREDNPIEKKSDNLKKILSCYNGLYESRPVLGRGEGPTISEDCFGREAFNRNKIQ